MEELQIVSAGGHSMGRRATKLPIPDVEHLIGYSPAGRPTRVPPRTVGPRFPSDVKPYIVAQWIMCKLHCPLVFHCFPLPCIVLIKTSHGKWYSPGNRFPLWPHMNASSCQKHEYLTMPPFASGHSSGIRWAQVSTLRIWLFFMCMSLSRRLELFSKILKLGHINACFSNHGQWPLTVCFLECSLVGNINNKCIYSEYLISDKLFLITRKSDT